MKRHLCNLAAAAPWAAIWTVAAVGSVAVLVVAIPALWLVDVLDSKRPSRRWPS